MNCLTDLGGKEGNGKPFLKDINWSNTHGTSGVHFGLVYNQVLGFRLEASLGQVSASDKILKDDRSSAKNRYQRNLSFRSNISEVSLAAEFYPIAVIRQQTHPLLSPYLLAGIGIFKFNPQAFYEGQWIELHPLRTEGQGFDEYPERNPYKLMQLNFPAGVGLRYEISALLNFRLETVYRFLKTDYLDDVSTQYIDPAKFYLNLSNGQAIKAKLLADRSYEIIPGNYKQEGEIRGNPKKKDSYFSFNMKIGFILNRKRR
jgi:hypothetical protein